MTDLSHSSSNLRRQPKQQRGKKRVEKILDAAAQVFDEVGYETATTHMIAAKAGTAIGSLYQFFPDKAAIFNAMELRHIERVKALWTQVNASEIVRLPLQQMLASLIAAVADLFENPVSRVMFVQFYTSREPFQAIDDSMTQEAMNFLANLLKLRAPTLPDHQVSLLAEICVHSSNAVMLAAFRHPDQAYSQQLMQEIPALMAAYLNPYMGDKQTDHVMKVMICPHCQSDQLTKNGYRRGKQCYRCKDCGKQFVNPDARAESIHAPIAVPHKRGS